jgi:predicted nucleotidyltransferase
MSPLLNSHREELERLCRRFQVRRLAVFGSAVRADFDPLSSDLDFIVEFEDPLTCGYADRYFELATELESLLGRRVDLLTERSVVNPIFRRQIKADEIELYAA